MTTTLREMLARRAHHAGPPNLDIEMLVGLGEARLRRRRIVAAASSAAVVLALALGAAAINSPVHRGDGPPVDHPSPSPTEPSAPPVRQLLYIDVLRNNPDEGTIHFGDRAITSADAFVHTDVTDDGFIYTSRDEVWFSNGGGPEQIGSSVCQLRVLRNGGILHLAQDAVMTGTAGSLVAWFACADPTSPTLVVYDTAAGREVVHQPMPFCATTVGCLLDDVVGEQIYFTRFQFDNPPASLRHLSYDVTTGSQHRATPRSYADDVRSSSRRLVVGDTWETATPTASLQHLRGGKRGSLVFHADGTRLAALWGEANGGSPATIFDTATHQAVQLRLPPDYHPGATSYSHFEWLDDDTIAVTPDHNLSSAEILTCRLSDGRCRVAVKKGPRATMRLVPTEGLPG